MSNPSAVSSMRVACSQFALRVEVVDTGPLRGSATTQESSKLIVKLLGNVDFECAVHTHGDELWIVATGDAERDALALAFEFAAAQIRARGSYGGGREPAAVAGEIEIGGIGPAIG